jgi:exosortase/archaeosortase family protein
MQKAGKLRQFLPFFLKLFIVLATTLLLVPFLLNLLSAGKTAPLVLNYTYTAIFSLLVIAVFIVSNMRKLTMPENYSFGWLQLFAFSAMSVFSFALFNFVRFSKLWLSSPALYLTLEWLLYFAGIFSITLAVFQLRFFSRFLKKLLVSFAIAFVYYQLSIVIRASWRFFAFIVTKSSEFLLGIFYGNAASIIRSGSDPVLSANSFSVTIGAPCSGVDSLVMFAGIYLLVALLDWSKLNKKKLLLLFPLGLAGAFLMNILRIFALMAIGASWSPKLALTLFHANAGWILFVIYTIGFFYFAYPWLKLKKR